MHLFSITALWWERNDIGYRHNRLFSGNEDLRVLAKSSGTPAYAYNAARRNQNLTSLSMLLRTERIQFKNFLSPQSQSLSSAGYQLEAEWSLWYRRMLSRRAVARTAGRVS